MRIGSPRDRLFSILWSRRPWSPLWALFSGAYRPAQRRGQVPECLIPHFWHENAIPRCVAEIQRLPQNGSVSGLRSLRWELSSVSSRCITGWGGRCLAD